MKRLLSSVLAAGIGLSVANFAIESVQAQQVVVNGGQYLQSVGIDPNCSNANFYDANRYLNQACGAVSPSSFNRNRTWNRLELNDGYSYQPVQQQLYQVAPPPSAYQTIPQQRVNGDVYQNNSSYTNWRYDGGNWGINGGSRTNNGGTLRF